MFVPIYISASPALLHHILVPLSVVNLSILVGVYLIVIDGFHLHFPSDYWNRNFYIHILAFGYLLLLRVCSSLLLIFLWGCLSFSYWPILYVCWMWIVCCYRHCKYLLLVCGLPVHSLVFFDEQKFLSLMCIYNFFFILSMLRFLFLCLSKVIRIFLLPSRILFFLIFQI